MEIEDMKVAEEKIKSALEFLVANVRTLVKDGYVSISAEADSHQSAVDGKINPTEISIRLYVHGRFVEASASEPEIVEAIMSLNKPKENVPTK